MPLSRGLSRELSRGLSRVLEGNVPSSLAATLLGSETQGMAIDFSDMSMVIRDTGTPANSYSGSPASKLTYTSPSTKWIRLASGLWASGTTLRTEYDASGNALGVLIEEQRTNLALYSNDLTNAVWVGTDAYGYSSSTTLPDGTTGTGTVFAVLADGGTLLQSITEASRSRITSAFVKRKTGSGAMYMTQNNGTNWTQITVTTSWTRVELAAATAANPVIGFKGDVTDDEIYVYWVQHESVASGTAFVTSPIPTTSATVTRAADTISIATSLFPYGSNMTVAVKARRPTVVNVRAVAAFRAGSFGSGNGALWRLANTTTGQVGGNSGNSSHTYSPAISSGALFGLAGAQQQSGAARSAGNGGTVSNYAGPDWTGVGTTAFQIGGIAAGSQLFNGHIKSVLVVPRYASDAELQSWSTP